MPPLLILIYCNLLISKRVSCLCGAIRISICCFALHPNSYHQSGLHQCPDEDPLVILPYSSLTSCRPMTLVSVSPNRYQDHLLDLVIAKNHPTSETPLFFFQTTISYSFSFCSHSIPWKAFSSVCFTNTTLFLTMLFKKEVLDCKNTSLFYVPLVKITMSIKQQLSDFLSLPIFILYLLKKLF